MKRRDLSRLFRVDKELIIVFLLVAIAGFIFFFVTNQRAFLNFFYIPVLLGAYYYGTRYAVLSGLFSIILIGVIAYVYPSAFSFNDISPLYRWLDIATWGGFLLITAYCMGALYEKKERALAELRTTYQGIIEMLSLVIESVDSQTQSHSYRVSVIAEALARQMGCDDLETENIRIAALLHDLGKIGVSGEILRKVSGLSPKEREDMKRHTHHGVEVLEPLGSRVLNLLPIILHHHEKYDGSGYYSATGEDIPLGARIIAVADVYDALTTDRPYRKAFSPLQAKNEILQNVGAHFDPMVVRAFTQVFPKLDLEGPLFPARKLDLS